MRIWLALLFLLISHTAQADLLLFSDEEKFHGCLDCNKYAEDSVCNKYGDYGSKYSDVSIWNKYGAGSKYEDSSPFSKYGTGLKVVDREGGYHGYFSMSYNGESVVAPAKTDNANLPL